MDTRKRTVLVVDDQLELRELMADVLGGDGYELLTAVDGLDALQQLAHVEGPCVVVSDLQMPRMSGRQLLRSIRNDAKLGRLPVVIVSSTAGGADLAGADAVIEKPFRAGALRSMVAHLFAA